jgi:hypothetical protein
VIIVVADAAHDKILALRGGLRRRRRLSTEFLGPCLGLGRRPVEDRYLVTTFCDQMSCHRETHHAETEKSDFSHVCNLGVLPALLNWPDLTLERGAGSVLETGSPEDWKGHNKPCSMKGNAPVWRAALVLC